MWFPQARGDLLFTIINQNNTSERHQNIERGDKPNMYFSRLGLLAWTMKCLLRACFQLLFCYTEKPTSGSVRHHREGWKHTHYEKNNSRCNSDPVSLFVIGVPGNELIGRLREISVHVTFRIIAVFPNASIKVHWKNPLVVLYAVLKLRCLGNELNNQGCTGVKRLHPSTAI